MQMIEISFSEHFFADEKCRRRELYVIVVTVTIPIIITIMFVLWEERNLDGSQQGKSE